FPTDDSGLIVGATVASADTSFEAMVTLQQQVAGIVGADPAVSDVGSILGSMTVNRGLMFVSLKPSSERDWLSTTSVIDRLRNR
ncbi:efflux RND transporter permease subunit, partial [Klebsiella pneumoniae]